MKTRHLVPVSFGNRLGVSLAAPNRVSRQTVFRMTSFSTFEKWYFVNRLFLRHPFGRLRNYSGSEKGVFWKRGLCGKVHFPGILENLDILEFLEEPPDCGKKRRFRAFSRDSREFRDFRDCRDFSSGKTPFVMTPFPGPELLSTIDFQSEVGEVFGEVGGELPVKFGRSFSNFFCWGKSSEVFSTKTPPQISPSNFTTRFWVVVGPKLP